ncbi:MAG: hypothetical protein AAGG75_11225 [Bacteroidota bacterium]
MKTHYLLLLLLLSLWYSCQAPEKTVVIDNSGAEQLMLVFDDAERIYVEPGQAKEVKLQFGKRRMKINNETEEEFYLDPDFDYLISPLRNTYYIETVHYFTSQRARERYYNNYAPAVTTVEGWELNGDFRKVENELAIKKTWQYGLDRSVSENLRMSNNLKKDHFKVGKIYRKEDLLDMVRAGMLKQIEEAVKEKEKK